MANKTTIKRAEPSENDVLIPNGFMNDERLKVESKGLFLKILGSRQVYIIDIDQYKQKSGLSKTKFEKALNELIECGYLVEEQSVFQVHPFAYCNERKEANND